MEIRLLRDKDVLPSDDVLKDALKDSFAVFEKMKKTITGESYALTLEWNYYNDGKSWLCKICHKKKTAFWLSVWNEFFQTGFYFTEKHMEAIAELDIDEKIKNDFATAKPIGKLIPLIMRIHNEVQLPDLLKIIVFKKNLK